MWYAMRAYKCEERAEEAIKSFISLDCFVAKRYELRVYHGKKYRKLVPLIPSLVFVRGKKSDVQRFKRVHQYLQYMVIKEKGKDVSSPLIVPDRQMHDFMKVANRQEADVRWHAPGEIALAKGSRVRIIGGLCDGVEGILLRDKSLKNERLYITLPGVLGIISTVEVFPEWIEVMENEEIKK